MATAPSKRAAPDADVIVVGSGAAGGMAAYALTQRGLKVLLLEAGRDYDPYTETPMWEWPSQAPLAGAATPDKEMGYFDATVDGGWDIPGEPYTLAEGTQFRWWRARMLGGRTNHWGRLSLRFGPDDFRAGSLDGQGADWPISYTDLKPWYDRVERLIGVYGAAEGITNSPDSPPGVLLPPPPPRAYEAWLQMTAAKRTGVPVVPAHVAVLTRPHQGRPACVYATPCDRGCAIGANFQSTTVLLPVARRTGRLQTRTDAMVHRVDLDTRGQASGVTYIDRKTGAEHQVRARAVMLAASALESTRILLMSRSAAHPNGLGNGSGTLGRYLTDTPGTSVVAQFPALEGLPPFADEGTSLCHVYSPWWLAGQHGAAGLDFARGYHIEYYGGRALPDADAMETQAELTGTLSGTPLKAALRRQCGSVAYLVGRGEMIPRADNRVELDPLVRDRFGLPVLRFRFAWGEQDLKQVAHMRRTLTDLVHAAGGQVLGNASLDAAKTISTPGKVIHELGTARMSAKPADGVLDAHGRSWEVPGLYGIDGAAFTSNPEKNPTLTILALAWRASERLAQQMVRRQP
jgi:choline dehydrogenase-like flavoprotein